MVVSLKWDFQEEKGERGVGRDKCFLIFPLKHNSGPQWLSLRLCKVASREGEAQPCNTSLTTKACINLIAHHVMGV